MAGDLYPGPFSSEPELLTAAGLLVFFRADDGSSGVELWAVRVDAPSGGGQVLYLPMITNREN